MLGKLLLTGVVGAGLAIGFLWPTTPSASGVSPAVGPSEVILYRAPDKHYYAEVRVNGHAVNFMVDTGAEQIALTERDARSAGLAIDPARYEVIGDGASGIVRGQAVKLKSLELNGISRQNVDAFVIQGASVSLLGQSFLEQVDEVVIRKGEMRLRFGG